MTPAEPPRSLNFFTKLLSIFFGCFGTLLGSLWFTTIVFEWYLVIDNVFQRTNLLSYDFFPISTPNQDLLIFIPALFFISLCLLSCCGLIILISIEIWRKERAGFLLAMTLPVIVLIYNIYPRQPAFPFTLVATILGMLIFILLLLLVYFPFRKFLKPMDKTDHWILWLAFPISILLTVLFQAIIALAMQARTP